jgi:4'-phosphopantetheinyl transferase EntD
MKLLEGMFEPGIVTCESGHEHDFESLLPEERKAVERAIPRRQREFASGRHCARDAMRKLGVPVGPVPMNDDRSPRWPSRIVGSISHCRSRCVAVAALKSDNFLSLGIDIEEAVDLDESLHETICTPEELDVIRHLPPHRRGLAAKAIFSAKESIFKCQFPLTGLMLDFQDVDVKLASQIFCGRIRVENPALSADRELIGQIRESEGHIITGISLKMPHIPTRHLPCSSDLWSNLHFR